MQDIEPASITTDKLSLPFLKEKEIEMDMLRLDKIHPFVSGNKWFKLRFYLDAAKQTDKRTILTYGGAWSNHILATAATANLNGMKSIGIIRGEEAAILSPTLEQAKQLGMQLFFTSRQEYSDKKIPGAIDINECYL